MREFVRAGHLPTLIASLVHFETSFMVWALIGGLGVLIAHDLGLSAAEKGLVVGVPFLGGALARVPVGWLADRHGPKRVGVATLLIVLLPLALGWRMTADLPELLLVGLGLGVAGSSFAVALPLAASWYPARYQGTALGIAAAGNSGVVLASLLAPRLGLALGWQTVLGLAILPVLAALALFVLVAREPRRAGPPSLTLPLKGGGDAASLPLEGGGGSPLPQPSAAGPARAAGLLREGDLWWLAFLYTFTFGGYAGFSSFLALYFHDTYGISAVAAGGIVALCALAGSLMRPVGGALADRLGGVAVLSWVYAAVPLALIAPIAGAPFPIAAASLVAALACLGLGNGAVFQLVPHRFPRNTGLATGVIGAAGGLGGFLLPAVLGLLNEVTGSYAMGLLVYALSLGYAFLCLKALQAGWQFTWLASGPAAPRQALTHRLHAASSSPVVALDR